MVFSLDPVTTLVVYGGCLAAWACAIIPVIKSSKERYNPVNSAFGWLLGLIMAFMSVRFFLEFVPVITGIPEPVFGINFTFSNAIGFFTIAVMLQFLLYVLNLQRHYALPIVWAFFVSLGLAQAGANSFVAISNPIASTVMIVFFYTKSIKNRDGKLFAVAMFVTVFTIVEGLIWIPPPLLAEDLFILQGLVGFALLALGTSGWLDRHVFYDRAREKRIKSTWIAHVLQASQAPAKSEKNQTQSERKVSLECPVCHVQKRYSLKPEFVESRLNDAKGIVKLLVRDEIFCPHSFVVYLDKNFIARGYETIDIVT